MYNISSTRVLDPGSLLARSPSRLALYLVVHIAQLYWLRIKPGSKSPTMYAFRIPLTVTPRCKQSRATPFGHFVSSTSAQTPTDPTRWGARGRQGLLLRGSAACFGGVCLVVPHFHFRLLPRLFAWTQSLRVVRTE